ncbi:MAG: potassium-transporting ATPase subunit F [Gluconobacter japonicus]
MTFELIMASVVTLALLVYMTAVLLRPEKF